VGSEIALARPARRLAANHASDRHAINKAESRGYSRITGSIIPATFDFYWGPPVSPYDPARAKKLLAEAGFGPSKPLKLSVSTRAIPIYVDIASYIIDQFKQVGIEATLDQIETGVWHPKMTRGEFDVAVNTTGIGPDDPDANFYENFKCGSPRNYSAYCSEEIDSLIEKQSQTADEKKRQQIVQEIDKRLQLDGARLMLGWSKEYVVMWPYVKNLVPHQSIYNYGRMQEVWLDK